MRANNRSRARSIAFAILGLFAAPRLAPPMTDYDEKQMREAVRLRRRHRRGRKRSMFSSRLGAFDPRPTSGGRNWGWKKVHAESMVETDRLRREGGLPDPRYIYDRDFRNVGIEFAVRR